MELQTIEEKKAGLCLKVHFSYFQFTLMSKLNNF